MKRKIKKDTHQLVAVPVQSCLLQHKPVLLPFDTQEAFAFFLPVQPALVIWLTQLFHRDSSPAHCAIACAHKYRDVIPFVHREEKPQSSGRMRLEILHSNNISIWHCVWSTRRKHNTSRTSRFISATLHSAYLFCYESASNDINIKVWVFFSEQSQMLKSLS